MAMLAGMVAFMVVYWTEVVVGYMEDAEKMKLYTMASMSENERVKKFAA